MAIDDPIIGADLHMYVGDAEVSTRLRLMTVSHTGGKRVTRKIPREFYPSVDTEVQTGLVQVQMQMAFEGVDGFTERMMNGNSLSAADGDSAWGPTSFQKYSLLFLHPRTDKRLSIWIPSCFVSSDPEYNFDKERATGTSLIFSWVVRNRYQSFPYLDDIQALRTVVGEARWPINFDTE